MLTVPIVAVCVISAITLLAPRAARAEYRVFQLAITNTLTAQTRTVTSTLDDIQYPGYYPLRKDEEIAIQDTWMCWERSDNFKSYCPNPRGQDRRN